MEAVAFAHARADWLGEQLAKVPERRNPLSEGKMTYRGRELRIDWSADHRRKPLFEPTCLRVGGPQETLTKRLERWLEAEAQRLFAQDAEHYCRRADLPVADVRLTRAKRRWGSCSSEGVLRLNWRLVQAPDFVRRSVVAHEVAHALARHGGERMTHEYVTNSFGNVVNYFSKDRELATQQRIHQAYGLVSKYGVLLPYSRKHESEADEIGLILMAKAGYDPTVAPGFWERFADASGPNSPEFFSTHPSELRRAEQLREQLENASAIYNMAVYKFGYGEPIHVAGKTPTEAPTRHSNTNRALLR
jgi:hypothetical protein